MIRARPSDQSLAQSVAIATLVVLAACVPAGSGRSGADSVDPRAYAAERIIVADGGPPPSGSEDVCWARDAGKPVSVTVREPVLVVPEVTDAEGRVTQVAVYSTQTVDRVVDEGQATWFRSPCPTLIDADFIASLQRALSVRGYFSQPATGVLDSATIAAVRQFQAERGLDSDKLSLAAARDLGLIAIGRDTP